MKNKIITLSFMSLLALLSVKTFTPTQALVTAPTSFNYSYRQSNIDIVSGNNWAIRNNGGGTLSHVPLYTQTYDGVYYDYVHNGYELVSGFNVYHTFNNSSTSWSLVSGSTYRPNNTALNIGSNTSSGTTIDKVRLRFDNQSSNDYYLYLDVSSSTSWTMFLTYNGLNFSQNTTLRYTFTSTSALTRFIIPSGFDVLMSLESTSLSRLFDAWYLENLGLSSAYDNGYTVAYDDGYDVGYEEGLVQGFEDANLLNGQASGLLSIFSALFSGVGAIFSINVFPNITLGMLVFFPIIFLVMLFVFRIMRGGS
jgi:hypothetical protein